MEAWLSPETQAEAQTTYTVSVNGPFPIGTFCYNKRTILQLTARAHVACVYSCAASENQALPL